GSSSPTTFIAGLSESMGAAQLLQSRVKRAFARLRRSRLSPASEKSHTTVLDNSSVLVRGSGGQFCARSWRPRSRTRHGSTNSTLNRFHRQKLWRQRESRFC